MLFKMARCLRFPYQIKKKERKPHCARDLTNTPLSLAIINPIKLEIYFLAVISKLLNLSWSCQDHGVILQR